MSESTYDLYQRGLLSQSLAAATEFVKSRPEDLSARSFLATLCCFNGELERADRQLDVLASQSKEHRPGANLFRQLIRGELARKEFHRSGRMPELIAEPSADLKRVLEASISLRRSETDRAWRELEEAEASRPEVRGLHDDVEFEGFRDLDDLTSSFFEAITSSGDYVWIPFAELSEVVFEPIRTIRDQLWRGFRCETKRGGLGRYFACNLYVNSPDAHDDALKLGRASDWCSVGTGSMHRGIGLRGFNVGEDFRTILEVGTIRFHDVGAEGG